MRKPIMLNLSEEELLLLVGILGYSTGDVLTEVYAGLVDELDHKQVSLADKISTQIAITANGYYINEDDLMHEVLKIGK